MKKPRKKMNERKQKTQQRNKRFSHFPFYFKSVQLASFEKWIEDLNQPSEAVESDLVKDEMILSIDPVDDQDDQLSIGTLNLLLNGLRTLSEHVAETLFSSPGDKSNIILGTIEPNDFYLPAKGRPFRMVLEVRHPAHSNTADIARSQTIEEIISLLKSSVSTEWINQANLEMGEKTLNSYAEWIRLIKDRNMSVDIDWYPADGSPAFISISHERAEQIDNLLSGLTSTDENEVVISGYLSGANIRTRNFEMITDTGEKVTGRMSKAVLDKIASFGLNSRFTARLLKVTVQDPDRGERVTWTLKDIHSTE